MIAFFDADALGVDDIIIIIFIVVVVVVVQCVREMIFFLCRLFDLRLMR
jgi:hypothetical protein|tara:strand:+ start:222 stop:368 length:147 start_codon:yes stop_codon:yes gene_type:complete